MARAGRSAQFGLETGRRVADCLTAGSSRQERTNMKLSFWTLGMPAWSNPEFADRASELGYGGVDLRVTNGGNLSMDSSEVEIDSVMEAYKAMGVEIASLLAYQKRGDGKSPVNWA